MNRGRTIAFNNEIRQARELIGNGEFEAGFHHLERAHVIGQDYVVPHVTSHWLMLKVELRKKRPKAVFGQFVRIVLGTLGSAVGIVPVGNTGGTDVSMFKRMPIEPELKTIIEGIPPESRL